MPVSLHGSVPTSEAAADTRSDWAPTVLLCKLHAIHPMLLALLCLALGAANAAEAVNVIQDVKASIVAVGTYQRTRSPAFRFLGTGFAVGDGAIIVTNSHVVPPLLNTELRETLVVVVNRAGSEPIVREVTQLANDRQYDLALLKLPGDKLAPLNLGKSSEVREGQTYLFTGFPLGAVLGLYPTTHRAMISAVTPLAIPTANADQLEPKVIQRLAQGSYSIFQLDATAYPGSSGSPLYDPESGQVIAIVNMAFVKGTKEAALSQPSGIIYAVPIQPLQELLHNLK